MLSETSQHQLYVMTKRDETYNRLVNTFGMSHTQANFVLAYATLQHNEDVELAMDSINDIIDYYGL